MNSTVFGSCTAMTELFGRPASMKCAASAEIARSACGEGQALRRLAGDARLVEGIDQRQRVRLARQDPLETGTSSVGDALVWITGSLRCRHFGCAVRPAATRFPGDTPSRRWPPAVLSDSSARSIAPER